MSTPFKIIIPARYASTRLPGKLLLELHGMTVLERVYRQALAAEPESVIIATDHEGIALHAREFGAQVVMTSSDHQSGSDRIAEVVAQKGFKDDDIIVNVQADEPFMSPALIRQVAERLMVSESPVATLCWPIDHEEQLHNPNVVKVVRNQNEQALYFSRAAIPHARDKQDALPRVYRHIGLYAYRAAFLLDYVSWPVCELESVEALEQLRILWAGYSIEVPQACVEPLQDINTEDDFNRASALLMMA